MFILQGLANLQPAPTAKAGVCANLHTQEAILETALFEDRIKWEDRILGAFKQGISPSPRVPLIQRRLSFSCESEVAKWLGHQGIEM